MAVNKLFNLLAIATLALFAVSFNAAPVTALTTPHQHLNRAIPNHGGIAKRAKRSTSGRCKTRSSSAPATEKTPAPAPSSSSKAPEPAKTTAKEEPAKTTADAEPPKSSSKAPAPTKEAAPAPKPAAPKPAAVGGGGKKGNVGIAWDGGDSSSLGNLVTDYTRWYDPCFLSVLYTS